MKKLFLVLCLLFPLASYSAITFDTTDGVVTYSASPGTTCGGNVTTSGAKRLLIVQAVDAGSTFASGSVTGGTALNKVTAVNTNLNGYEDSVWVLDLDGAGIPTGTTAFTLTSNASAFLHCYAYTYNGVNQTSPYSNFHAQAGTTAADPTNTTTSVSGETVIDCLTADNSGGSTNGALTPGGGQTARLNPSADYGYESEKASSGTSVSISWTGIPFPRDWADIAISLTPDGGGAPPSCPKTLTVLGVGCDFSSVTMGTVPVILNTQTIYALTSPFVSVTGVVTDPLPPNAFNPMPATSPMMKFFQQLAYLSRTQPSVTAFLNSFQLVILDQNGNQIFP